ncbi:MAG: hypothetical protein K8F25_08110, partial [Fimbriimonadaceae bacterium]|nr:hypothetical protein [Alphaproteobacteria bacterium]
ASVVVAAMLPTSLEQEIRALPPGPVEERMIEGVGWWRTQMTSWNVDLPANRLRQYVDELSRMDWQTGYCLLRATGLFDEKSPPSDLILQNGKQVFECE